MVRPHLKKTLFLFSIGTLIIIGLLYFTFGSEEKPKVSDEVSLFESNFYEFLNSSFEEIINIEQEVSEERIQELAAEGINQIDKFQSEHKKLSALDLSRLNQLRFYVYSSISLNEEDSRNVLDKIPAGEKKLALLTIYIETFANKNNPNNSKIGSEDQFKKYINDQASWAEKIDPDFFKKLDQVLFNASPVGKLLPNHFKGKKGTKGEDLNLELYRGKYVLVDYWATWCLPCIAELPYLIEAYNRFSDDGFEIISVSLDNNEKSFEAFIKERNINWIQYYDGKAFSGELVEAYGINAIPTLFLLDPDGKVMVKNLNGETLVNILKKKFL